MSFDLVDGFGNLPRQVRKFLSTRSVEEREVLVELFADSPRRPSFQEWLEVYQQYSLLDHVSTIKRMLDAAYSNLAVANDCLESAVKLADEDLIKKYSKQVKQLSGVVDRRERMFLDNNRELNKVLQNHLSREMPRKVEVTSVKVTPGDVSNLIRTVDVDDS